jgi:serine phosphatase RsbU (regulator of sigma subunit)
MIMEFLIFSSLREKTFLASRVLPATELSQEILNAVRVFVGDHPQSDDITLMVIRSL